MSNAMYVWSKIQIEDKKKFLDVCALNDVGYVFLSAYLTAENSGGYARFMQGGNLKVLAMASTNEFALCPDKALKYIEDIIRFNEESEQKFCGVHFDVEPHCLPGYKDNQEVILRKYIEMVRRCYQRTKEKGLEFGLSIPFWYKHGERQVLVNVNGMEKPCSFHLIDSTDHVSIMAYRPNPNEVVNAVKDEMGYSRKKVFVAVDDISKMEMINARLNEAYEHSPVFEGIAIHHYGKL